MKKIFLFILTIYSLQNAKALSITDLSISPINGTNDLKVNFKTYNSSLHYSFSVSHSMVDNVITITACYSILDAWAVSHTNQNVILSGINNGNSNYTLIVNLHGVMTTSTSPPYVLECNLSTVRATASLNFYTTLTNTVILSNENFDNLLHNIYLYPNPNFGSFSINGIENCSIEIYDVLGKLVYTKEEINTTNQIVTELKNGIYLVKIINEKGKTKTQKMIVE